MPLGTNASLCQLSRKLGCSLILPTLGLLSLLCLDLPASAQEPGEAAPLLAAENALVEAIARGEKSVVSIARVKKQQADGQVQFPFGDELNLGFGRVAPDDPTSPDYIPNEFATGVVIDARGLILTCYHALGEDSEYYVTTSERRVYSARIKGADPRSDLAVLEIEARDLEPIAFGDADTLRKGQIVISLGNPYAIARDGQVSASWGIVSNLSRKASPEVDETGQATGKPTLHHFGTLIQTDARLNLGTSGGALINLRGEMVGLTTSLAAVAGYEQAAGYAVPVDETFLRVVNMLKQGREVEYGFLGVQPGNLTLAERPKGATGMRITNVVPGTPAQREGLRPNDIVTQVNGRPIHDADGLMLEVGRLPAEGIATLLVHRPNVGVKSFDIVLAKAPIPGKKIITNPTPAWRGARVDWATVLVNSPDNQARNDSAFQEGCVAVIEVENGSPAWGAGLRPGMLITHVGGSPVQTPREFRDAVAKKRGKVDLRIGSESEGRPVLSIPPAVAPPAPEPAADPANPTK